MRMSMSSRDLADGVFDALNSVEVPRYVEAIAVHVRDLSRPSSIFKPTLHCVKGMWYAKYGDVEVGGKSPTDALKNFDREMEIPA
jgi:hypothetical protein